MPAHPATVLAVAIKTRYQRRINLTWETGTFAKNYSENRFFPPHKKEYPYMPTSHQSFCCQSHAAKEKASQLLLAPEIQCEAAKILFVDLLPFRSEQVTLSRVMFLHEYHPRPLSWENAPFPSLCFLFSCIICISTGI